MECRHGAHRPRWMAIADLPHPRRRANSRSGCGMAEIRGLGSLPSPARSLVTSAASAYLNAVTRWQQYRIEIRLTANMRAICRGHCLIVRREDHVVGDYQCARRGFTDDTIEAR